MKKTICILIVLLAALSIFAQTTAKDTTKAVNITAKIVTDSTDIISVVDLNGVLDYLKDHMTARQFETLSAAVNIMISNGVRRKIAQGWSPPRKQ